MGCQVQCIFYYIFHVLCVSQLTPHDRLESRTTPRAGAGRQRRVSHSVSLCPLSRQWSVVVPLQPGCSLSAPRGAGGQRGGRRVRSRPGRPAGHARPREGALLIFLVVGVRGSFRHFASLGRPRAHAYEKCVSLIGISAYVSFKQLMKSVLTNVIMSQLGLELHGIAWVFRYTKPCIYISRRMSAHIPPHFIGGAAGIFSRSTTAFVESRSAITSFLASSSACPRQRSKRVGSRLSGVC